MVVLWTLCVENLSDQSLFIYKQNDIISYFLVYVDDIVLTSSSEPFTAARDNRETPGNFHDQRFGTIIIFLGNTHYTSKQG